MHDLNSPFSLYNEGQNIFRIFDTLSTSFGTTSETKHDY